ncbi:Scavenger receptor cysteine-rich domain-containing group B protein, partial [Geodia barretti]
MTKSICSWFAPACIVFQLVNLADGQPQIEVVVPEGIEVVNGSSTNMGCSSPFTETGGRLICGSENFLVDGCSPEIDTSSSDWASQLVTVRRNEGSPHLPFPHVLLTFTFDEAITSLTGIEVDMFQCPDWGIGAPSVVAYFSPDTQLSPDIIFSLPFAFFNASTLSCDSLSTLTVARTIVNSFQTVYILMDLSISPPIDWVHVGEVRFLGVSSTPHPGCVSPTTDPCEDGQLRLVNGTTTTEGRVEICFNNTWGTVCDDFWDNRAASVVCNQLGISPSFGEAYSGARYGQGQGPIYLDDVECFGDEESLLNCSHRGIGVHNCYHGEDAGVLCIVGVPISPGGECDGDVVFNCGDGSCYPISFVCDGYPDCRDGSDEDNCDIFKLTTPCELSLYEGGKENFTFCLTVTEDVENFTLFRQFSIESFTVSGDSAKDGVDHTFSNQTITFAGNYSLGDSECAVVNVTTIDDNIVEGTEVISVFITPGPIVASIFIIDNDYLEVGFESESLSVSESAGGVEIAVRALPNENGNIPDIGKPFGLRV